MATAEEGLATQIRNIEARYGKTMAQWSAIVTASGLTRHRDVVSLLKSDHGLPHGAAHRVSLTVRQQPSPGQPAQLAVQPSQIAQPGQTAAQPGPATAADPVSALYAGRKAALRPLHEALMTAVRALGDEVDVAPKKGYLSLRRGRQFAMIQPSGAGRIDVGLILPATPETQPGPRLESAAGFNALFTHRVRVPAGADIDPELIAWLRLAYQHAAR
jgi:Domain of unknown function (DUF5655)/Domain of unknown function (DUF4287)